MPRPSIPSAGSPPAASIAGAVEVKPMAFRSAARMADADVVSGSPASSSGLSVIIANGAISEYQPPDATSRPSMVSGASVWSAVKVTAGLVSSLNGRGAACTGTRSSGPVSYTHLRAHETRHDLVCRLLLEKKKRRNTITIHYLT